MLLLLGAASVVRMELTKISRVNYQIKQRISASRWVYYKNISRSSECQMMMVMMMMMMIIIILKIIIPSELIPNKLTDVQELNT